MDSARYYHFWSFAEKYAFNILKDKIIFPTYSGHDIIFVFMIMFLGLKYHFKELDFSDFMNWYIEQLKKHLPATHINLFVVYDSFYDDFLLCEKTLRASEAKNEGPKNPIFLLSRLMQQSLNSCGKSIAAKNNILKHLTLAQHAMINL